MNTPSYTPFLHTPPALSIDSVYKKMQWLVYPLNLFVIAMIVYGSQNRVQVLLRFLSLSLVNYLMDLYIILFAGRDSMSGMVFNVIHQIINLGVVWKTQEIAGKDSPMWLWYMLVTLFVTLRYDVAKRWKWVLLMNIGKIIANCICMRHSGGFSIFECVCHGVALCISSFVLNVYLYYITIYDLEMHRIYENLSDQIENFRSLLWSVSDALIRIDKNGIIDFMKNEFNGKPISDFLGTSLWNLFTDAKSKLEARQIIEKVFSTGKSLSWESKHQDASGNVKYFSVRAAALNIKGQVTRAYLLFSDITERKIAEQRRVAAEKAKIESRAKSQFISSISHELRNPLQAIMYTLQILSRTKLDIYQNQYIEHMLESAKLLSSIIGNVLDISKIEAGRIELEKQAMSVLNAVETTAEILSSLAIKKGLRLITYVDSDIPILVIGDFARICQILNNFVSNAIKFTNKGTISVSANLVKNTENSCTVRFECRDTGIGMKEEDKRKVFDPFVQLHNKVQFPTHHVGWGLGLHIAKKLVELMNGKLGVESTVGVGSTFWFEVTFAKRESTCIRDAIYRSKYPRVLLILECDKFCEVIKKKLEAVGVVETVRYRSFAELEKSLEHQQDQVIITDTLPQSVALHHKEWLLRFQKILVLGDFIEQNTMRLIHRFPALQHKTCLLKQPVKLNNLMECLSGRKNSTLYGTTGVAFDPQSFSRLCQEKQLSILIVEDNLMIQQLLKKLLIDHGANHIDCASNGLEAVQKIEKKEYSIILLDLQMPVMNGFEAAKAIRRLQDPKKSNIPIIATSANVDHLCKKYCMECGIDAMISKPICIEKLLYKIQQFVDEN